MNVRVVPNFAQQAFIADRLHNEERLLQENALCVVSYMCSLTHHKPAIEITDEQLAKGRKLVAEGYEPSEYHFKLAGAVWGGDVIIGE